MIENFPSMETMVALDLVILAASILGIVIILVMRRRLKELGALAGAILMLLAILVQATIYAADLYSMTFLPSIVGMSEAMQFMTRLHSIYNWYASTISILLVLGGLIVFIVQTLRHSAQTSVFIENLQLRQDQLDQAAKLAKLGYYIYNTEDEAIEFCTEMHARNHGLSREEFVRLSSGSGNDLLLIHPDDRTMVRQKHLEIRDGLSTEFEYRVPTPTGQMRIREVAKPIFNESGEVVRVMGTSLDVTEQYETERKILQSQKFDSIGHLTGGVAHDFNNIMAVTLGNLELLRDEDDSAIREEYLAAAIDATMRGADLTKSLLSFARKAPLNPVDTDLNEIVGDIKNWSRRLLPANIIIETKLVAGLWSVYVDTSSLENAMLNLLLNARDAMPNGGKLTIETANKMMDGKNASDRRGDIEPGRYVMLAISDTGQGIPQKKLADIFEPFHTTKKEGEGSGLGLSMVQGFVTQSGGAIRVHSKVGVGTTFKLYFKAAQIRAGEAKAIGVKRQKNASSSARILLAEDEEEVSRVVKKILENAGYSVTAVSNGDSAFETYKAADWYDLLLTDMVMPGQLQGPALARSIRNITPDLPCIFMSGYASENILVDESLEPTDTRLVKPVSASHILTAVSRALDSRSLER